MTKVYMYEALILIVVSGLIGTLAGITVAIFVNL